MYNSRYSNGDTASRTIEPRGYENSHRRLKSSSGLNQSVIVSGNVHPIMKDLIQYSDYKNFKRTGLSQSNVNEDAGNAAYATYDRGTVTNQYKGKSRIASSRHSTRLSQRGKSMENAYQQLPNSDGKGNEIKRFNEEPSLKISRGGPKSVLSKHSGVEIHNKTISSPTEERNVQLKEQRPNSVHRHNSSQSNSVASYYKSRLIEAIGKLGDKEVDDLRKKLNIEEAENPEDGKSHKEGSEKEKGGNDNESFISRDIDGEQGNLVSTKDEATSHHTPSVLSSRMSVISGISRRTQSFVSGRSIRSSATFISHLEHKLDEERRARERLERELEELKRISLEILNSKKK